MAKLPSLTAAQRAAYFDRMLPYAQQASAAVSIPVSVILGQWALESYYGTSDIAKHANNHGGIKYVSASTQRYRTSAGYAGYGSESEFVKDYIRVMGLNVYTAVRQASDSDIEGTLRALGNSPYAESHYESGGTPGNSVLNVIKANDLYSYDGSSSAQLRVDKMAPDDLKKYAAIGLAFVGLLALAGGSK